MTTEQLEQGQHEKTENKIETTEGTENTEKIRDSTFQISSTTATAFMQIVSDRASRDGRPRSLKPKK